MRSTLPVASPSALKVEEFLRFKQLQSQTSLASTLRTSHPDRQMVNQKQEEMKALRKRNEIKQAELNSYQKEYDKLSLNVRDAIYQLKTEQDEVDQQIEQLRKHKLTQQEEATTEDSKQRLNDLTLQIQLCKSDKSERVQRYQQDIQRMDQLIEDEKRQFKELVEKVGQNEQWLVKLQQKHQSRSEPVDVRAVRNEIELIKASNNSILKQQATERKRFRKEAEDVRKQLKEYTDKSEDRMKSWLKKCQAVVDGKKQWKDVLPESYYSDGPPEMMTAIDVEAEYLGQLQAIGMLYEPQERSELGDLGILTPYNLKAPPFTLRQSQTFDRLPVSELEDEIRHVDKQFQQLTDQLAQTDGQIERFKDKISKLDQNISSLKQSVDAKKKK